MKLRIVVAMLTLIVSSPAYTTQSDSEIKASAAEILECSENISINKDNPKLTVATGCGKSVAYETEQNDITVQVPCERTCECTGGWSCDYCMRGGYMICCDYKCDGWTCGLRCPLNPEN